jgi:hypothetical protein
MENGQCSTYSLLVKEQDIRSKGCSGISLQAVKIYAAR